MPLTIQQQEFVARLVAERVLASDAADKLARNPAKGARYFEEEIHQLEFAWLSEHPSVFSPPQLLGRWESVSGKDWLELLRQDYLGREAYAYKSARGGGRLDAQTLERAAELAQELRNRYVYEGVYLLTQSLEGFTSVKGASGMTSLSKPLYCHFFRGGGRWSGDQQLDAKLTAASHRRLEITIENKGGLPLVVGDDCSLKILLVGRSASGSVRGRIESVKPNGDDYTIEIFETDEATDEWLADLPKLVAARIA